ncbi:polysaccharide deacetylase family protein [Nocardioides fonticola]|uniref:Polysaccharide deacetylase family protein n=1 Tax=Nocardioides fonticola TaxID=450363 RepID=A0ABP7XP93_9ACTN
MLMYHSIGGPMPDRLSELSVPAPRLREHLDALRSAGYRLLGLDAALAARAAGERVVALTFDDGYPDFLHAALPILEEHDAGATLYVPTRHLGGRTTWLPDADLPLLDAEEVAAIARRPGIEVGSHAARHVPLDVLPAGDLMTEVAESAAVLGELVDGPVAGFCYPHGYHAPAVRSAVRAAGFTHACAIGHRVSPPGEDPWALSRLLAGPQHDAAALLDLVEQRVVPGGAAFRAVAGPPWRWTRRVVHRTTGRWWT